jgi:hypothetical protein
MSTGYAFIAKPLATTQKTAKRRRQQTPDELWVKETVVGLVHGAEEGSLVEIRSTLRT